MSIIIQYDNLPVCRHDGFKLKVTTEGCYKPCLSSKTWCVRSNIRSHICGNLDSIEAKIDKSGLGKRYIRALYYLRLHLNIENMMLGKHIIGLSCKSLRWFDVLQKEVWMEHSHFSNNLSTDATIFSSREDTLYRSSRTYILEIWNVFACVVVPIGSCRCRM